MFTSLLHNQMQIHVFDVQTFSGDVNRAAMTLKYMYCVRLKLVSKTSGRDQNLPSGHT